MNEFSRLGIERGEREWRDVSESDIGSEGGGAERSREDKYATPRYDDGASMKVAMNLLQRQPSVCRPGRPAMPRTGTGLLRAR